MEQNDQVQDGPLAGSSGEVKKDTSKEENSAAEPSVKKEEKVTQAPESSEAELVDKDDATVSSDSEEMSSEIKSTYESDKVSLEEAADSEQATAMPEALSETTSEDPVPESQTGLTGPEAESSANQKVQPETTPGTDPKPEDSAREDPEAKAEEKSEDTAESKPEAKAEEKSEDTAELKPEAKAEEKIQAAAKKEPEAKAEEKSEDTAESKPEAKAEEESEDTAELKPEAKIEEKIQAAAKKEPEAKAEEKSEDTAELKPEAKTGKVPESTIEGKPAADKEKAIPEFDYSSLTREDLVNRLEVLIENQDIQEIRSDVDHIKVNFYKKNKAEIEARRKKFIEEGGSIEDFQVQPDHLEERIKGFLKKYRDKKTEFNKTLEVQKKENLQRKYEVIEKIKELINRKESINKTFNEFRDLQREWRLIGLVPQQNLKDLWNTYNHHVEKFYDYIKINKELRDLDLKKNLELKMQLCERAEELLLESSVINAFNSLQKYHERWREIGPVPVEARTDLWERFKQATSKINKRHQKHFEDLKKTQKKNLEQKILLCEKAEDIANQVLETHKQWDNKSKELIELQKVWKTIGFAPKKDNNKIYERFRTACDTFFNRKREFYAHSKELQLNNLQLKMDLCVQAESLKDSKEWKKTTEDLINLQKKWKDIGPVAKKHSDPVWKRFRAACDYFFQQKSEYYQNIDQTYSSNLAEKKKLLKELESLKLSENVEENFKILNDFQRKWSEIGFVPFKEKEAVQEKFRIIINKHFDSLNINDSRKDLLKFRNKLNNLQHKSKANIKIDQERERYLNRLQQLKNDIILWENNIGFFAKSKNAESMINEVQSNIDNAKETIRLLEQKIEMIDNMDSGNKI